MVKPDLIYVGYKFKIYPTEEQIKIFEKYFGYARFVYNLGKDIYDKYHEDCKDTDIKCKYMSFFSLNNEVTRMKQTDPNLSWMYDYSAHVTRVVLKDLINGYNNYYHNITDNIPTYKSKKNHYKSFPTRGDRMSILGDKLWLSSFDEPILIKQVPSMLQGYSTKLKSIRPCIKYRGYSHITYHDPRITYNGIDYFISFTIKRETIYDYSCTDRFIRNDVWNYKPSTDIIGLDFGIKLGNWFVGSDGSRLCRPDQTKLDKQIAGYKKRLARQKRVNDEEKYIERINQYTNNELETLKRINKACKKHTNQRLNAIHNYANELIEQKPEAIVMETLSARDMIKGKSYDAKFIKNVSDSLVYTSVNIITYKAEANGIPVIFAEPGFKSTQTCSNCGHEQKMGTKRVFKCPCCGKEIDRDFNAALNLKQYGENYLHGYIVEAI